MRVILFRLGTKLLKSGSGVISAVGFLTNALIAFVAIDY